jgi:hypothetical protein
MMRAVGRPMGSIGALSGVKRSIGGAHILYTDRVGADGCRTRHTSRSGGCKVGCGPPGKLVFLLFLFLYILVF